MNLFKKALLNFGIKKRIDYNNSIYEYKTEGISPKGFRNYQNQIDLFENLRDGSVNPREVTKNQINFKSDTGEIKKRNPK